jgi:hypothetical protein
MLKVDSLLNWIIILLGIILIVTLFVIPKDHCDTCNFDGKTGKEWFKGYSSKCLQLYSYGEENPNIATLNLSSLSIQS